MVTGTCLVKYWGAFLWTCRISHLSPLLANLCLYFPWVFPRTYLQTFEDMFVTPLHGIRAAEALTDCWLSQGRWENTQSFHTYPQSREKQKDCRYINGASKVRWTFKIYSRTACNKQKKTLPVDRLFRKKTVSSSGNKVLENRKNQKTGTPSK